MPRRGSTSHFPAVSVTDSERLPTNVVPVTLSAACLSFCSRNPLVTLRSLTVVYYVRILFVRWLDLSRQTLERWQREWGLDLEKVPTADQCVRTLLLDPQTSGGLLIGVPAPHATPWERARAAHSVTATRIGEVTEGQGVIVTA